MIDDGEGPSPLGETDSTLARVVERITCKLQAGESVDEVIAHNNLREHPIRDLLPTLNDLTALGRSLARRELRRKTPGETNP